MRVAVPDAVVHPRAMVIMAGDADIAQTAVLAPGRLGEAARGADGAWVEEGVVEWVQARGGAVVARCDNAWICYRGLQQEAVGEDAEEDGEEAVACWEERPGGGEEESLGDDEEGEEEHLE